MHHPNILKFVLSCFSELKKKKIPGATQVQQSLLEKLWHSRCFEGQCWCYPSTENFHNPPIFLLLQCYPEQQLYHTENTLLLTPRMDNYIKLHLYAHRNTEALTQPPREAQRVKTVEIDKLHYEMSRPSRTTSKAEMSPRDLKKEHVTRESLARQFEILSYQSLHLLGSRGGWNRWVLPGLIHADFGHALSETF